MIDSRPVPGPSVDLAARWAAAVATAAGAGAPAAGPGPGAPAAEPGPGAPAAEPGPGERGGREAGRSEGTVAAAGRAVLARYAEPHRHYHTVAHVAAVVEALFLDLAADPASVELAAFFHDAVYDPEAPPGANERASAALAASSLPGVGVPAPAVGEVVRLVLTTIDHRSWPGDANAAVLNDADLSTLGAAPGVYGAYVAGVRAEYAWLGEREWRAGRGRVVLGLLARPRLYATERGVARWEAAARANLRAELEELEATN